MEATPESPHIATEVLPALLVAWPLACAALVAPLGRWREGTRDLFVVAATGVTLLGAAALVPLVASEHTIGVEVPLMIGRITFVVDSFGMLFALFTAFVWFAATLYAVDYMKHEHRRNRFYTTSLVVLSAMLGVVIAGDLITLYLFFEALGLVAFLLVVHTQTTEAKRAGVKYFWMTLAGGFALVGGIFLTFLLGGNGALAPLPPDTGTEGLRWTAFALLALGFGVKAGMLPVHVWLPDAHPVAPSPASALLSGVMIKAGAYGIFRTATALFRPPLAQTAEEALWRASGSFGLVILWIGIATMSIGVMMALGQSNAKRMLAYHSVSQMGFILAGIGAAAYLGTHGAMGAAGGLYHVVNHALFKAALFLGVGAVAFRTGELDMYRLGGLWRKMPLTFVLTAVAAAGITGVPLFNGFVSKCLIHHALVEAYEFEHLFSLDLAEKIYVVTCGGTACSFIKLIGLVFLGKPKREYGPEVKDAPPKMLAAMGLLAAAIVVLGVRPALLLEGVFAPGLHTWGLHSELLDEYLAHMFLSAPDLLSVVWAFGIGIIIFVVGMRFGLFHLHAPRWFGVNFWYVTAARGVVWFCGVVQVGYETLLAKVSAWSGAAFHSTVRTIRVSYEQLVHTIDRASRYVRAHARSAWRHSERNWRRLVAGLARGAPELRDQAFVRDAALTLRRERHITVRAAIDHARLWLHEQPSEGAVTAESLLPAVREVAGSIAEDIRAHRIDVLTTMVGTPEFEAVRESFDSAIARTRLLDDDIAAIALELGRRSVGGADISRELGDATMGCLREERFAHVLRELPSERKRASVAELRAEGRGRAEVALTRVGELARVLTAASTQEHVEWFGQLDAERVVAIRRDIQRYARDMSVNVAVILIVFLMLIVSIAASSN